MNANQAEICALGVLSWLASNDELLPVFMGATGAGVDDLRDRAADPAFLGSVLDFLMMDDAWVIQYCDGAELPYEIVMQARMALPGGQDRNWT